MYMYNHIEMARVTGVPASYLLTRCVIRDSMLLFAMLRGWIGFRF
jgi:hypothetical protein